VSAPTALADHLAWLQRECGAKPCTCPHEWRGLGILYGISLGHGWVRMTDDPGCPEHGHLPAPQ
jgi:hypothetical protein